MKHIKYIFAVVLYASSAVVSNAFIYNGWIFGIDTKNGYTASISGLAESRSSLDVPASVIDDEWSSSWVTVNKIYDYLFSKSGQEWNDIKYATSATIPSSITNIGYGLFLDNTAIKSVNVKASVNIPPCMFQGCTSLTSVSWAGGTTVGSSAFKGCTSLKSMSFLPSSIKTYESDAFNGAGLVSFSFGPQTSSIGTSAFENVTIPELLSLPNSVSSLSSWCFAGCSGLSLVNFGDGTLSISQYAFSDCKNLQYLIFGKNTKSISENAFAGCNDIKEIYINSETPPSCSKGAFSDDVKSKATLFVPEGSYAAYWSSREWEDFKIVEKKFEPISSISMQPEFELVKDTRVLLHYSINPQEASIPNLKFVCSNPSVAEVSSDGFISGKKAGNTIVTIFAQDGSGVRADCSITVKDPEISMFEVTPKNLVLRVNEQANLAAYIKPDNTNKSVTWTSADAEIAVVKERDGVAIVLARAVGETEIIVKSNQFSDIVDSCKVVVVEESILVGDVNEDRCLDENDLSTLVSMLLHIIPVNGAADVNRDGVVNGLDFVALSKRIK